MSWNTTTLSTALAIVLLGMTFVPVASAQADDRVDEAWETYENKRDRALQEYDEAQDDVDQETCDTLKGGGYTAWECVQAFYCGGSHCIERKIWSP